MTNRQDAAATLPWMRNGTGFIRSVVDRLTDADFAAPSALPGWTRAHVIGHIALNAEALHRLALWARTGVETPMYASLEQRAADIQSAATLPPSTLRRDLASTAARLEDALAAFDDTTWHAQVRSALGRAIPAAEIPWMRVREVWVHAVDLAAGATFADFPVEVADAMLDDVTDTISGRPECPSVRLAPVDRDRTWRLGATDREPAEVTAPAADLLAWVTGREAGAGLGADGGSAGLALPPWL